MAHKKAARRDGAAAGTSSASGASAKADETTALIQRTPRDVLELVLSELCDSHTNPLLSLP